MDYLIKTIEKLVNIPSPSGYTKEVMDFVKEEAKRFGYSSEYSQKGGLIISVKGQMEETVGLSAHVDTLGAMVRSITSDGMIKIALVGGYTMHSIEGSYCQIHTRDGRTYDDARTLDRSEKNMEIRIDEIVKSKEDVLNLGINSGDYISFDPQFSFTEKGFVKSRHLDDKASVAVLLTLLKNLSEGKLKPKKNLKLVISNYEEVGFGASFIPNEITEFIAVDMGVIGDDLNGTEYAVSICAKDSSGPYDYELTNHLISLAKENKLDYVVDIFPHYGSDVSAALRGGNNIKGALIGQGIHASHGMERTHITALENTLKLVMAYVL